MYWNGDCPLAAQSQNCDWRLELYYRDARLQSYHETQLFHLNYSGHQCSMVYQSTNSTMYSGSCSGFEGWDGFVFWSLF